MENNVDNSEHKPLTSTQCNSEEQLILNQGFIADTNCFTDITSTESKNSTDTNKHEHNPSVDLQYYDNSLQKHNYNNSLFTDNAKIRNQTIAAGNQFCGVYGNNPSDLHFPPIDMNVDIDGKGLTTAVGTMNTVGVPADKVNNTSGSAGVGRSGSRSRASPPSCQDHMAGENYPSPSTMIQHHQSSSLSYGAEFDPLAIATGSSGNGRGYGSEGGVMRGIDRYAEWGAASGNGARANQAAAAATATRGSGGEKAAYELLDREMQYMLKFADPDQNLASMDELIQSGVDLLDLLPPEEGGVKPGFSNPSNDWKYDIIAKYVDACNPVSECTCHHYDGKQHDIHLCSVHHDTVSQDSDTLTMDTEGSLVNIPTIKLHSTYTDGKSDFKNNNNMSDNTSTTTTTIEQAQSQPQQHPYTKSDIIDRNAQCQDAIRTEANNKGGNIKVGYDGSSSSSTGGRDLQGQSFYNEDSSGNKSTDRSLVDTANHTHQCYSVDGRTGTGNGTNVAANVHHSAGNDNKDIHMDLDSSEGHRDHGHHNSDQQNVDKDGDSDGIQNSTVFAEVHVDATGMKYDEPTSMEIGDSERTTQQSANQSLVNAQDSTERSHDPVNDNVHERGGNCDNTSSKDKQGSSAKNTPSSAVPPSHQQANNDTDKSTTTSDAATAKNNPDPTSKSSPAESSPTSRAEASTSSIHKENYEKFLSRPQTTSIRDHRKRAFTKRPGLPIEPRTTQYQKHALLQERSGTGVLEFELLLAERFEDEEASPPDSVNNRKCSLDSSRMKLLPRTNQYEPHPLLQKRNSGMSEIEEVLQEKEQEFIKRMNEKRNSADANSRPDPKKFMLHRGSLGRLEPRLGQYENHSLLQSKDEDGRTALEMFLEEELIERKASMTDNDTNYGDKEKLAPKKSNASDSSSTKGSIKKSRSKSSSLKKVHFERSGSKDKKKKPEDPESGISSKGEASSTSDPKQDLQEGQGQGQTEGQEVDNGYDTDDDDKTEEDRLTGERAKANLNKDQGKCCTIL